jgi:hypothetical protein
MPLRQLSKRVLLALIVIVASVNLVACGAAPSSTTIVLRGDAATTPSSTLPAAGSTAVVATTGTTSTTESDECSEGDCVPLPSGKVYLWDGVQLETMAPHQLLPGATVPVRFNAFDPGVAVEVWIRPVLLSEMVPDSEGAIEGTITIPLDATPGVHVVKFSGTNGGGPRDIEVLVEIPGQPTAGDSYGIYFDGFVPSEEVAILLGPLEWVVTVANQDGGVFTQVPAPLSPMEISATGSESGVTRSKSISPAPSAEVCDQVEQEIAAATDDDLRAAYELTYEAYCVGLPET